MNTVSSPVTARIVSVFRALVVVAISVGIGWFVYHNAVGADARYPFKLGLDLAGGSHLVYEADVSSVDPSEVGELMNVLRDVIERRINIFGVSEPIVQVESGSFVEGKAAQQRLVVELPGVTDVAAAVAEIGKTPLLEFKLVSDTVATTSKATVDADGTLHVAAPETTYIDTGLTGRYLTSAALEFANGNGSQFANEPTVAIHFDADGASLFEQITSEHVGERLAIFLDGELLSAPNINEPITGGDAIISGNFTPETARDLAQNLNFGALPVPISLVSTQTVGATLGGFVVKSGITAGLIGLSFVMVFMMLWYRLPGLVASVALLTYVVLMLAAFQLIPVTLTAAGLAGFILSLGMAVDANVLVFERMKEELRAGKDSHEAAKEGFKRAWSAIRDGNVTSILSAIILFWFGTSLVKGFALVFGLGVIVSMITAVSVTRTLLLSLPIVRPNAAKVWRFLFTSGFSK